MKRFRDCRLGIGAVCFAALASACDNDSTTGNGGNTGGSTSASGGQSGTPSSGGQAGSSSGGMTGTGGTASGGAAGSSGATGSGGANATGGAASGGTAGAGAAPDTDAGADSGVREPCSPPAKINAPIEKLSDTGCMDPKDPTKLASFVLPYEVNSPLWSDSADKSRGMRVPDGKKIHAKDCAKEPSLCSQGPADDGKWVLPVGTVMVKNFMFDDKLVETRLFVHFDASTWVGYSYQWNEGQTEATIVPDARTQVTFNTGKRMVDWHYPSRVDCMLCHNPQGGSTIGPETAQMNRVVNGKNQIDTWQAMGLFDAPPAKNTDGTYKVKPLVLPYPGQLGTPPAGSTVEEKTRSYLHANCAFCHRPDGDFMPLDLRRDTPFKDMGLCNVTPTKGDVGVIGALNLVPGMPDKSVMYLRMNASDTQLHMPRIATYHIDDQGVKLVSDWITSITSCPQ